MAKCNKCGKMAGIPSSIPLRDTRTGTTRTVKTDAGLLGNRATLKDQRGMNQRNLAVKNPLNGKK